MSNKCTKGHEHQCLYAKSEKCHCACGGENHGQKSNGDLTDTSRSKEIKARGGHRKTSRWGFILGDYKSREVFINGKYLDPKPSLKLRSHSPDGFAWGYGGSGPSQLSLAILLHFSDKSFALKYYQDFKWLFIAGADKDDDLAIPIDKVELWIKTVSEKTNHFQHERPIERI